MPRKSALYLWATRHFALRDAKNRIREEEKARGRPEFIWYQLITFLCTSFWSFFSLSLSPVLLSSALSFLFDCTVKHISLNYVQPTRGKRVRVAGWQEPFCQFSLVRSHPNLLHTCKKEKEREKKERERYFFPTWSEHLRGRELLENMAEIAS